jgi:hypothetical protein
MLCREPGTIDDPQRGRKVCAEHRPHRVRKKLLHKTLSIDLQLGIDEKAHDLAPISDPGDR